jgi:hypothetical protein
MKSFHVKILISILLYSPAIIILSLNSSLDLLEITIIGAIMSIVPIFFLTLLVTTPFSLFLYSFIPNLLALFLTTNLTWWLIILLQGSIYLLTKFLFTALFVYWIHLYQKEVFEMIKKLYVLRNIKALDILAENTVLFLYSLNLTVEASQFARKSILISNGIQVRNYYD